MGESNPSANETDESSKTNEERYTFFIILLLVGFLTIVFFSLSTFPTGQFFVIAAETAMIAGAAAMVGAFFGFIFGIPKTMQPNRGGKPDTNGEKPSDQDGGETHEKSATNTNLEDISDWLTKILVGAGITQISVAPGYLWRASGLMGEQIPFPAEFKVRSQVFVFSLIIFFSITGFFISYLWARVVLLEWIEDSRLRSKFKKIDNEIRAAQNEKRKDVIAHRSVDGFLENGEVYVTKEELDSDIKKASYDVQKDILIKTSQWRSDNWKVNKKAMERCIPIFISFLDIKEFAEEYSLHAKLGYAYKDKRPPDYIKAKETLSDAIKFRDEFKQKSMDRGFKIDDTMKRIYEYNRAICSIMLDPDFNSMPPAVSTQSARWEIMNDLILAYQDERARNIIDNDPDPELKSWMELNDAIGELVIGANPQPA